MKSILILASLGFAFLVGNPSPSNGDPPGRAAQIPETRKPEQLALVNEPLYLVTIEKAFTPVCVMVETPVALNISKPYQAGANLGTVAVLMQKSLKIRPGWHSSEVSTLFNQVSKANISDAAKETLNRGANLKERPGWRC